MAEGRVLFGFFPEELGACFDVTSICPSAYRHLKNPDYPNVGRVILESDHGSRGTKSYPT